MKFRSRSKILARVLGPQFWGVRLSSLFFIVLALVLYMFSALNPSNMNGMRSGMADLFAPVLSAVSYPFQETVSTVQAVTGIADMQAEIDTLKGENAKLRRWYQQATVLQAENKELRRLLNVKPDPAYRYLTARVIADSGNAYLKSLLVLAGNQDGVAKGQAVLGGRGLVGRIVETGRNAARILLLTDVNSRVPVVIEGENLKAILAGDNEGKPYLEHLPSGVNLTAGLKILTSGDGGVLPYGLPVGQTAKGADGHIYIRLNEDASRLTHVRILDRDGVFDPSKGLDQGRQ